MNARATYTQLFLSALPPTILFLWNETTIMQQLYITHPRTDIIMHLLGGACIVFTAGMIVSVLKKKEWRALSAVSRCVLLVGAAVIAGILWEWYEFISDLLYGTHHQLSRFDTMKDLFNDGVGGMIASLFFYDKKRN